MEIQTQLVLAGDLDFGNVTKCQTSEDLSHEVGKMLVAMMGKL